MDVDEGHEIMELEIGGEEVLNEDLIQEVEEDDVTGDDQYASSQDQVYGNDIDSQSQEGEEIGNDDDDEDDEGMDESTMSAADSHYHNNNSLSAGVTRSSPRILYQRHNGKNSESVTGKGSARKGAVSTAAVTAAAQSDLIASSKSSSTAGLTNGHTNSASGKSVSSSPQAAVAVTSESPVMTPMPSLTSVEEEPIRYVVLNDTRNLAPFATCLCSAKPVMSTLSSGSNEGQQQQQSSSSSSSHQLSGTNNNKTIFCQAIDCVDGKMIGCCNPAKLTLLFRSSKRVPYRIYCEVHLARLRRHHCCPGCGLFCTQGEFLQCFSVKKQVHLFHKSCQVVSSGNQHKQHCPHCAGISDIKSVPIAMNGPVQNNTVFYLLATPVPGTGNPKARITGPNSKSTPVTGVNSSASANSLSNGKENNISITGLTESRSGSPALTAAAGEKDGSSSGTPVVQIPGSQKFLSVSGMPIGPARDMLSDILTAVSQEKKSPIRLTPNKNFYTVARIGETDKVVALLMQGFDPNYAFEDHENETPLHAASQAGHVDIVHLLMLAGAEANVLNSRLNTPLMTAIEAKQNDVVAYLVKAGAAIDFRGEDGMTALHLASRTGNREAVKILLSANKKLDVNLQDDGGWTALIWATEHKQADIIELLLDRNGDPNVQDDEENTCLHWAAFAGDPDILTRYLDIGCDIDAANVHGDTACHIAARRDHESCLLVLTARGADVSLINAAGETPISCCPNVNGNSVSSSSSSYAILKVKGELMQAAKKRRIVSDKVLHPDIAKGRERHPISIVNRVDETPAPSDYTYVKENCETTSACTHMDRTISSLQCCQCGDEDCGTSGECICGTISFRVWYDRDGRLDESFNYADPPMIFECNRGCNCWINRCSNRVVQKGIRVRMQVFRTPGMGWGVRALTAIPKGSFVCEYVGEIIPDKDADDRSDDSYLFDLDHRDKETLYCVDARFYGNVARFINHGCDANLTPVKVFIDHQDLSFPRMAFFANRDIKDMEELTFDYGEKFWAVKCKDFQCECGSVDCRFSKSTINRTMQCYWHRMQLEQQADTQSHHHPQHQSSSSLANGL